jgi:hypothetical protein
MPIEFLVLTLGVAFAMFIIGVIAIARSRHHKHRLELQKAILERVGSVKELAEFLTTEQGERFLTSLAPAYFRPHHRGLWSVRIGIVLLTIGVFLMIVFHLPLFGSSTPPALLMAVLLLIASGLGMLLSAAVSFLIARRLGIGDGPSRRSQKDDAV